jgi:LemA protein
MSDVWRERKGWIIMGVLALVAFMFWGGHSGRVGMRNEVLAANAEIQNQYQRRADLVPNLVRTVEGAANFERGILKEVVEARSKATHMNVSPADLTDPVKLKAFQDAQGQLSGALSRLLVTVERYPDLKASANYRDLQAQLEGTENRVATARARQITAARNYNTSLQTLTGGFYTAIFSGFREVPQFVADEGSRKAPEVKFGTPPKG